MTTEIWKDIKGYEGMYQVSSHGRVKSLDRVIQLVNGGQRTLKGKLISPAPHTRGYVQAPLSKDGVTTRFLIHRLVAEAFIPNPQNKPQVNHKDEVKTNNRLENLEWFTQIENINYGTRNQKAKEALSYKVRGICIKTNKELIFSSHREAARVLGISQGGISGVVSGRGKTAGGYRWESVS